MSILANFLIICRVVHCKFAPRGHTVNAKFYFTVLRRLSQDIQWQPGLPSGQHSLELLYVSIDRSSVTPKYWSLPTWPTHWIWPPETSPSKLNWSWRVAILTQIEHDVSYRRRLWGSMPAVLGAVYHYTRRLLWRGWRPNLNLFLLVIGTV